MSTKYPDIFAALAAHFGEKEVKVRQQAGRNLSYITARTAMNRLDVVLGGENWWDDYIPQENSVLCRLTVRFPDGQTVTKSDAGGYAGMSDQGDDDKSGYSDAFKRAAVKFGVGRYLYRDGVPSYEGEGAEPASAQQRPQQPAQAPRSQPAERRQEERQQPQGGQQEPRQFDGPPRSGRGMFAWSKEAEQKYDMPIVKPLNEWAKAQGIQGRMVDWTPEQARKVYDYAVTLIPQSDYEPEPVAAGVSQDESDGEDIPF